MNVISLFDGMGCGQIALNWLGIKPDKYYASEIDKHAIKVSQTNFPDTIHLGDITKWQTWDIDFKSIDMIFAGSPCQGFSVVGKGLAFDDPRSKLFFVFVDILNHVKSLNPNVKYLLENVFMKYEHELVISKILNINPIKINSTLVSAQNRNRNYWTNINTKQSGLFGFAEINIPQPKDKKIFLKDILETDVPEKYFLSQSQVDKILSSEVFKPEINPDKAGCLTLGNNAPRKSGSTKVEPGTINNGKFKRRSDKSLSLDANYFKGHDNHGARTMIKYGNSQDQKLSFGKSQTLNSGHFNRPKILQVNPSKESGGKQPFQQNRVYDSDGKLPALNAELSTGSNLIVHNRMPRSSTSGKGGTGHLARQDGKTYNLDTGQSNVVQLDYRIRRLTPVECCRLQTVPDDYFYKDGLPIVSETQMYKMLGNGWTVDVIAHILSFK